MINFGRLERLENKVNAAFRPINPDLPTKEELKDFLSFIKYFYQLETGREYRISQPICRQSHQLVLAGLVPGIINQDFRRLMINIPPRYGKTIWAIHLIAYGLAFYPDSQYLYISFSAEVAIKQTSTIRSILELPQFNEIFGVGLHPDFKSKHDFMTTKGGRVLGLGAGGSITSNGAGIKYCERFGGCAILDDMHKPAESHSKAIRDDLKIWFQETFYSRINQPDKTPVIYIGQITHEDDIPMNLRKSSQEDGFKLDAKLDTEEWKCIILPAIDEAGNALDPETHPIEKLREMQETMRYTFWAQYQQQPQPAGGSVFPREAFQILEERPDNIVETFITVDTAETSKNFNDASVFSLWGMYRIKENGRETNTWALHWLQCQEIRVEPRELKDRFLDFYYSCCRFKIPPSVIGIEKKSTGVTLLSVLADLQDVKIVNTIDHRIEFKKVDEFREEAIRRANKIDRFLAAQPFVCSKRITFDKSMKHANLCLDHLVKITANDTHLNDDIADTMSDAIMMIPFMEKQVRKPNTKVNIPGYKAIPNYRGKKVASWHS